MEHQAEGEAGAARKTRDSNGWHGAVDGEWPVYGSLARPDDDRLAAAEEQALAEATRAVASPDVPPMPAVRSSDESRGDLVAPRSFEPRTPEPLGLASPNPATCPFLRSQGLEGRLRRPLEAADPENRCAAFGEPRVPSLRQQESACLALAHVDCQRYRRGALAVRSVRRTSRRVTSATLAAVLVLVASASASLAFVVVRGGLTLPAASNGPVATGVPAPSALAAVVATTAPTPVASVPVATPEPTPESEPAPTPTPTVAPTSTPTPPVGPTPAPTSDRYQLLVPCPSTPDCYIYTVRRGDNLTSIARYFGVPLATVRQLNPWTATKGIDPGENLILPPPTR